MRIHIKVLWVYVIIGLTYGLTVHLVIIPFFKGQLLHCIILGISFGVISYSVLYFVLKKYFKLKEDNKILSVEARYDSLTGLMNRQALEKDLSESSCDRDAGTVSVIFIDVDNFREFNNKHGHQVADSVLHKVGQVVKMNVRSGDKAYRYGGEEIVVILRECRKENAVKIADKIRNSVSETNNDPYPRLTVSVGVASYPEDGENIASVIKASDEALIKAKNSGKNCVVACP